MTTMKKLFFKHTWGLMALALLGGGVSCSQSSKTEANQEEPIKEVRVQKTSVMNVEQKMDFTGTIEPYEMNYISPSTPTRITKILVEVGDRVKKGQLLVQMDLSQYRQAITQLENLRTEFARQDTLYQAGSISLQQLDQIRTQLEVAETQFENLKENTQLRSPINGVVTGRYFENGEMYSMGSPAGKPGVLSVAQINPVKVEIHVPEARFPFVTEGMPVNLKLDVYPDTIFTGKVHIRYPTIDAATRTFTVELKFPNREELIRPGMFGRVNMVFETHKRVVAPDMAVQKQQGSNERYVFVVEGETARRKTVKTGIRIDDQLEIISGLNPGEDLVIAGHAGLLDGAKVKVVK